MNNENQVNETIEMHPNQNSQFATEPKVLQQNVQENPFGNPVGQPQMMQQNPFGSQMVMQPKVKKPMKLGWIISLTILILSIFSTVIGAVMLGMGVNTVKQDAFSDSQTYKRTTIDPETYKYDGLQSGKEYYIVLSQESGPEIISILIDGKNVSSSFTQSNQVNSKTSSIKMYRFTAKSDEVTVELSGITKKTEAKMALIDGAKYGSAINQAIIGIAMLVLGIIVLFISLIAFIIFLIIFLVKNSKYKTARQYTSMI